MTDPAAQTTELSAAGVRIPTSVIVTVVLAMVGGGGVTSWRSSTASVERAELVSATMLSEARAWADECGAVVSEKLALQGTTCGASLAAMGHALDGNQKLLTYAMCELPRLKRRLMEGKAGLGDEDRCRLVSGLTDHMREGEIP